MKRLKGTVFPILLLIAGKPLESAPNGIRLLAGTTEIELCTVTQPSTNYELQSSSDLSNWLTVSGPHPGDGNNLSLIQALIGNRFYRFRSVEIETAFAPAVFPFDRLEDFDVTIPGFEEEIVLEPIDENQMRFEVRQHTDPQNEVGVTGEMAYTVRPENPNTADLIITYEFYTTLNTDTQIGSERTPAQQAAEEMEPQITVIHIFFVFEESAVGSTVTTHRFTDDSEEVSESTFDISEG